MELPLFMKTTELPSEICGTSHVYRQYAKNELDPLNRFDLHRVTVA